MIYKAYKIRKSEYSNLPALLNRIGLVTGNEAAPDRCVVSRKTYKVFGRALYKRAKKEYPMLKANRLWSIVNLEILNLGPARLNRGVEFGYIVTVTEPEILIK